MANETRQVVTSYEFQVQTAKLDALERKLNSIKQATQSIAVVQIAEWATRGAEALYNLGERAIESLEKTAALGEKIHIAAESAGITAEAFQKLAFSAKQNSISNEEMEHGMLRLSRALYSARTGGAEAQKSFAMVGISPDQIQRFHTSQDALYALADRFKNMKDPIEKQALAQQLLGRSSMHTVAWLSQGSTALKNQGNEAQKAGAILTSAQIGTLVKLNHEFEKVNSVVSGLAAKFAVQFAPAIQRVAEDFLKFINAIQALYGSGKEKWIDNLLFGLGVLYGVIKELTKEFLGLSKVSFGEGLLNFLDNLQAKLLKLIGLPKPPAWISNLLSSAGAAIMEAFSPAEGDQKIRTALTLQKMYGTPLDNSTKGLLNLREQDQPGYTARVMNSIHVEVHVPSGMSASDAGHHVANKIAEKFDQKMRETDAGVSTPKVH